MSESEHTDIPIVLCFPIRQLDDLMNLVYNIAWTASFLVLEVIAFIGGVESENALLFEDLKVMQDNHHSNGYLLFLVV